MGRERKKNWQCSKPYINSDTYGGAEMMAGKFVTHSRLKEKEMEDLNLNPILREECYVLFLYVNY